jgi:hypothetical protein
MFERLALVAALGRFVVFRVFLWLSLPTDRALLPSTFLVQFSSVHTLLVAEFLSEKQSCAHV